MSRPSAPVWIPSRVPAAAGRRLARGVPAFRREGRYRETACPVACGAHYAQTVVRRAARPRGRKEARRAKKAAMARRSGQLNSGMATIRLAVPPEVREPAQLLGCRRLEGLIQRRRVLVVDRLQVQRRQPTCLARLQLRDQIAEPGTVADPARP